MAPPLLILRDIHLRFGAAPLLEGAELSISEGDRLCLVGRNGSGKSTLLKIAAGLIEADRGEKMQLMDDAISERLKAGDISPETAHLYAFQKGKFEHLVRDRGA